LSKGRPVKNKTIKSIIPDKKKCDDCKKELIISNFYNTNNVLSDGKSSICKKCTKKRINYNNMQSIYDVLKGLDIPFFYSYWATCKEKNPEDPWTIYIRIANSKMNEFKTCRWKDSIFEPQLNNDNINNITNIIQQSNSKLEDFIITDYIIDKWNYGYSKEEYYYFEKKYNQLKNNYLEKTSMHTEALLNYIRYRVKEELSTAKGNVKEAKEWGQLAKDAATAAKINPSQLSKADLSDGLSTFSELSQAVEREVDIIPILPRFKCRPNDALDFNIWCYINYIRDMKGLPPCEYEDVYKFYDKKVKEYIKQYGDPYGIFSDDTSVKNRDNIKKFISEEGD